MKRPEMNSIRVWNRQNALFHEEPIYRGGTLRFLFWNPFGRILMRHVLPYKTLNNWITRRQRRPVSRKEIIPFIEHHQIDTSEFLHPVDSFSSFAEFFTRELRPEARPISGGEDTLVAPCDGRIEWLIEKLSHDTAFHVKGQRFTLPEVFSDAVLAEDFAGGSIIGFYLAPFDYHRFCYPFDGTELTRRHVGDRYYSVNDESIAAGFRALDCNMRSYTVLVSNSMKWSMIEVAGFYAGRIVKLDESQSIKEKGSMKGCFDLGGSFILLVFPAGCLTLDSDIRNHLAQGTPVRVRLGEGIGTLCSRRLRQ